MLTKICYTYTAGAATYTIQCNKIMYLKAHLYFTHIDWLDNVLHVDVPDVNVGLPPAAEAWAACEGLLEPPDVCDSVLHSKLQPDTLSSTHIPGINYQSLSCQVNKARMSYSCDRLILTH